MVVMLYVAGLLFTFLIAYALGRVVGLSQGRRKAEAEVPIMLRSVYQLESRCPICDDGREYLACDLQNQG
ncbi:hypothetical protein [Alicyclobacillus acidoterrestris]|uniref:Uncharacterized protein n=1 Tax=Alicyclobacillus acidoterrestris (strain ATCC 49025 / DSM 3922 / CIP 106132 / NCIMB 13137 / GD3B) TaxID=1356854 RepID=T0DN80_ALIAG|nr:hypothetical protein [Alicyclobacillus acidoterrestris]EPZ50876.1 hypothetical protein N007_21030 [Alicyclobacillus acidoterrestris ATCC 49025]UNO47215.1 hypothetical protein K1I37_10695 [Alicyclobacillus acidoterrestris]